MDNDAKAVANAFIKLAGRNRLTNMQLQKLVYIAHGYSLALLDEPLFRDKVYAWPYGPVVPSLYDALKKYGAGEVTEELYTETPRIRSGSKDWTIIRGIWNSYGKFSGPELSAMTHKPGTPWDETRTKGKLAEIDNETIKRYYRELLNVPGRLPETAFQPSQ